MRKSYSAMRLNSVSVFNLTSTQHQSGNNASMGSLCQFSDAIGWDEESASLAERSELLMSIYIKF